MAEKTKIIYHLVISLCECLIILSEFKHVLDVRGVVMKYFLLWNVFYCRTINLTPSLISNFGFLCITDVSVNL